MSYNSSLASLSRTRIDLIEVVLDYCSLSFGVSPCTASGLAGSQCYNTFTTCQDTANYAQTSKSYKFINANLPLSIVNSYYGVKPYIKSLSDLATEIKENDTVVKRLKVEFFDELDNDVAIDPYRADRASIQGSFWKKLLARNTNYKGRLIKQYEGFEGLAIGDFQLKFVGKIENISIDRGIVTIEAVDLLSTLSDIEYPLKTGAQLLEPMYNSFSVSSEAAMLQLSAYLYDFAVRTDWVAPHIRGIYRGKAGGTLTVGSAYDVAIVGYDAADNAIAYNSHTTAPITTGFNRVYVYWDDVDLADHWFVFWKKTDAASWQKSAEINTVDNIGEKIITSDTGDSAEDPPAEAYRIFQLIANDPSNIANWDAVTSDLYFNISSDVDISSLTEPGYVKIDDEIIFYKFLYTNPPYHVFDDIKRAQFGSEASYHETDTRVDSLLYYFNSDNPFTILKDILDLADIDSAYIDSNFTTLESAWSDISFATLPIVKNKLSEIYFDLVNAVDCMSWVGEDGKIKILEHSETPGSLPTLTEVANFIGDSISVDLNEESRYTRWLLYWNRKSADGSITDEDDYASLTIAIDAVAEDDEYQDEIEDVQTSTWLNSTNDVPADVVTYINNLLAVRKNRTRNAQPIITADVELKDTGIVTGDLVNISTSKLQNADGADYSDVTFRVIKKEIKGNKISLKLLRRYDIV